MNTHRPKTTAITAIAPAINIEAFISPVAIPHTSMKNIAARKNSANMRQPPLVEFSLILIKRKIIAFIVRIKKEKPKA